MFWFCFCLFQAASADSATSATGLEALFGKTLVRKMGVTAAEDETVSTCDAFRATKQIGVFFSAHRFGPCRHFTSQLVEEYKKLKSQGFEIVFASSDKDRTECKSYFEDMGGWLTLPYDNRDLKNQLSKKYKVQGIPTLVILDNKGELLTTNGRPFVGNKPFPYQPPVGHKPVAAAVARALKYTLVANKGGKLVEVKVRDVLAGKNVALYFSAHWCGPCRAFTPKLAALYNRMKKLAAEGKRKDDFEFVFISSDKDEAAFKEYFGNMPWLALPYANREGKSDLSSMFEVRGIPSLITLDPSGKVINSSARGAASTDTDGAEFPWHPKPVNDINDEQDGLNEETCVIVLTGGASDQEATDRLADLNAVGSKYYENAKSTGTDAPFRFFYSKTDGGLVDRIRQLCKVASGPKTIILDIPDNGGYYYAEKEGDVEGTLAAYKAKKLTRRQLS